jgi:hypothetical protein
MRQETRPPESDHKAGAYLRKPAPPAPGLVDTPADLCRLQNGDRMMGPAHIYTGPGDTLLSKYQQRAQNHPARPQTPAPNRQANKIRKDVNDCLRGAKDFSGPIAPSPQDAALDTVGGLLFTVMTDGGGAIAKFFGGAMFTTAFTATGKLLMRGAAFTGCEVVAGEIPPQAMVVQ